MAGTDRLDRAVRGAVPIAEALFDEIGEKTRDGGAITRAAFGPGEQAAADAVARAAGRLGLDVTTDWIGNVYMTRRAPGGATETCVVGSHLDSVPRGGNYDGLAGVLAGLVAVAAMKEAGIAPTRDIAVMGIRAEENAWFGAQHIGSRAALGRFDAGALDSARRVDTGRTLAEHIAEAGLDAAPIRAGRACLDAAKVRCFLELHIEQGPVLDGRAIPVGIVTGIRGNVRSADCRCVGAYGHSGTVPRSMRQDAVMAAAELIAAMDSLWADWEDAGRDLVMTVGKLTTDAAAHSITTIPGEVRFTFDARSHSADVLADARRELVDRAAGIGRRRGVEFRFGPFTEGAPVSMDARLQDCLAAGARALGITAVPIPSGAGHDAADFADAGVPAAMVFVRNAHGSHNPDEAMTIADFAEGTRLLTWLLAEEATT